MLRGRAVSELAQLDALDVVVGALAQNGGGAVLRRLHVGDEVWQVDALPDRGGTGDGLFVAQFGVAVEVGVRVGEGRAAQTQEAVDVPLTDVALAGIDEDAEVEEVGDRERRT